MLRVLRQTAKPATRRADQFATGYYQHRRVSPIANAGNQLSNLVTKRTYFHYGIHNLVVRNVFERCLGGAISGRSDDDDDERVKRSNVSKAKLYRMFVLHHNRSTYFKMGSLFPFQTKSRPFNSTLNLNSSAQLVNGSSSRSFHQTGMPSSFQDFIMAQSQNSLQPVTQRRNLSTSRSKYKTSAKIPEPVSETSTSSSSMFSFASFDPKAIATKLLETTWSITKAILKFLIKLPGTSFFYITHPQDRRDKIQEIKDHARKEFDHYWTGSKLLVADVRTARDLLKRTLTGSTLTRRERKQLLRTVTDLFRLIPFSMFLIIPAAEFALPFALRIFPNMLPSTFQDSLKAEESMKRELQSRIAMAYFFQETLKELAKEQKRIAAKRQDESPDNEIANMQEQSAESMLEFLERARTGEMMPPDVIVQYAKYFQDDLTLDNMPRMQLVNMCRYMQLQPYGADSFLRFQLRHRIRQLKEDDQRIIWEGIGSLTKMELREACQERGMRSTGLSKDAYIRSLQQWLDLSVHKNVPISLLIMSRTFFLQEEIARPAQGDEEAKSVASLADAISGMDKEVLNEVILEVATKEEKSSNPDIRKIKLEVVTQQNERIREEREAAEKKKKASEKTDTPPAEESLAAIELELSSEQAKKLAQVVGAQTNNRDSVRLTTKELDEPQNVSTQEVEEAAATVEEEKDHELSAEEMDAISQLLSADPVSKEREELARIKSAILEKEASNSTEEQSSEAPDGTWKNNRPDTSEGVEPIVEKLKAMSDDQVKSFIEKVERDAKSEADNSTSFSTASTTTPEEVEATPEDEAESIEDPEDPVVARLKKRLQSMVDKIELQLSDVEQAIGDKLHMLDKDSDGVLSLEEMAECLHVVLKREITIEEAMEIAKDMDENADGVFTVQELYSWIERNTLVQLHSEGRDADMDRIMEQHSAENKDDGGKGDQNDKAVHSAENYVSK